MSRRALLALQWLTGKIQAVGVKADPAAGFVVDQQHGPARSRRGADDRDVRFDLVQSVTASEMRTSGLTLPVDILATLRVQVVYPGATGDHEAVARRISDSALLHRALQTSGTFDDGGTDVPVSSNVQTPPIPVSVQGAGFDPVPALEFTTILRFTEAA